VRNWWRWKWLWVAIRWCDTNLVQFRLFVNGRGFWRMLPWMLVSTWQHWGSCCVVVATGTHSYWETGSVCQQYWIHFTQTKCYQEYWSFQGHYLIKALPAYCSGILRMWLWGRRPSWMGMYIYLFVCCIFSLSGQCLIFIYLLCLLCTYRELWRIRRLNLTAFLLR
jgi:hypothetical protein